MIRKSLVIFLISIITVQYSFSQKIRFSFLANPQIAWLQENGSGYQSEGALLKMQTGIEMDIFFAENYAFSTGLNLNGLGGRVSYSDSVYLSSDKQELLLEPDNIIDYSLQYLSIPLGLKFKTIEIGYMTFWINPGISTMVKIKSKADDETGIFNKTDISDELSMLNFNYFIEAGIEYSIGGNTAIVGGIGYNSGFMDITTRSTEKLTTQSFSLIIGVLF